MHALSVKHLSKSFGTIKVLDDVSIFVSKNEFVSIIGPSGSGKSTLFHILTGIDDSFAGEIFIENEKIINRRGKFGYMPQDVSLFPWRTVLENIMLGPEILEISKKNAKE